MKLTDALATDYKGAKRFNKEVWMSGRIGGCVEVRISQKVLPI